MGSLTAACIPFLLTFRIKNGEQVLQKGLKGYTEYMEKVRWKLIPYVW
jgi:protein-S-isoprenylcysteine O-methyltransferase Ste14